MSTQTRPKNPLPATASGAGKIVLPVNVRLTGTPSGAHLDKLTQAVARGVLRQLRAARGAVPARRIRPQHSVPAEQAIRQHLARVEHDLGTGIGVRSPAALAELNTEKQRLTTELAALLAAQLEQNRKAQSTGIGVRSPAALTELADDERRIVGELAVAQLLAQHAPLLIPQPQFLPIDWSAGLQTRGLTGERLVGSRYYPEATELPRNFPAADFLEGGTRTPLTGTVRVKAGKLPLSSESFRADGGRLIQVKTLDNGPGKYTEPGSIADELTKGLDKFDKFERGLSRSETRGAEVFRAEHSGNADEKVLHVELFEDPSPAQLTELAEFAAAAQQRGVTVRFNWPKLSSNTVTGLTGVGFGVAGALGRANRQADQQQEEGYAPVGGAAYAAEPWYIRLGSFFRGDLFESSSTTPEPADVPVFRANLRKKADAKRVGETLDFNWQKPDRNSALPRTLNISVTYKKAPDGRWVVEAVGDAPSGFTPPDINRIIDPAVSDSAVDSMLTTGGA
ncbi:hypothetical protein ACIA8C_09510 [Nocardia sp. NPDC051321]|uniref:hypothetical protein n=1 Tax=Nocardia sp. NPDC051321 TaxID=3364323 RepID=UPI0037A278A5